MTLEIIAVAEAHERALAVLLVQGFAGQVDRLSLRAHSVAADRSSSRAMSSLSARRQNALLGGLLMRDVSLS